MLCYVFLCTTTLPCDLSALQMRAQPFLPSRTRSSVLSSGGYLNSNSGESPDHGLGTYHPERDCKFCQITYVV